MTQLWEPTSADREAATLTRFMDWLHCHMGLDFDGDPKALWRWSVDELEAFWGAVWDFFAIEADRPYETVLEARVMPGARWFTGARLNYAEQLLSRASPTEPALVVADESGAAREVSLDELRGRVGALAAALAERGVKKGDRVAAYVGNVEAAVVALLATTSLGAVWTACAPDFGTRSVVDRLSQADPKVLIAVDGYRFNGREFDRRETVAELQAQLPGLEATILVRNLHPDAPAPAALGADVYDELVAVPRDPVFEPVDFDHPLWILYSSGTTGLPKGIVHGHGGIVLEHVKALGLDADQRAGDRWFLHSSTSWMAWNWCVGALVVGATPVIYDGNVAYPERDAVFGVAERVGATTLLVGSAYVAACQKAGVALDRHDLSRLKTINLTGSPLPDAGWQWVADQVGPRVRIESTCGGTDVCTAFFGGNQLTPVWRGEISTAWLGVHAQAWDPAGQPVVGTPGEFVVTAPMPSMPLRLLHDPDESRLHDAYFDEYPGVWRQGDSITITERGSVVVHGRSDATLNRGGVRLGAGEIYGVLAAMDDVADALVIGAELADGDYYMPLFVVPAAGVAVDADLRDRIARELRAKLSPRHVPDDVIEVPVVPRTLTGKMLEVPVKRILQGTPAEQAAAAGSIDHPEALTWFEDFRKERLTT